MRDGDPGDNRFGPNPKAGPMMTAVPIWVTSLLRDIRVAMAYLRAVVVL
jgi:hypothetical protein